MKKLREDSVWNRLTSQQRELLDHWLFEENIGYADAVERIKQEFGVQVSIPSVNRYFKRLARERQFAELMTAVSTATALEQLPVSMQTLSGAALKLVGQATLKLATEKPHAVADLARLTRLLVANENVEVRRRRVTLAERNFDYAATAAAHEELPKLPAYMNEIARNPDLSDEQRMDFYEGILYGWDPEKRASGNKWLKLVDRRLSKAGYPSQTGPAQPQSPPPKPPATDPKADETGSQN